MSQVPDPEALVTGVILAGPGGEIRWMNRSARSMTGATPDSVLPDPLAGWVMQVAAGRDLNVPEARLEGGTVADVYLRLIDNGVLIELHPVAERVRQRELADRADRQQSIAQMLRTLAHELRNPLGGIRAAAQLISQRGESPASQRHAELIQREVDRVSALLDRIVAGESGALEPLNLHQVIDEAWELVRAGAGPEMEVDRDFDPSIPGLMAASGPMHQLFLNLFLNAVQAGARRIRIRTRIERNSPLIDVPGRHALKVDIDDDGSGVPEALRDRLFLPLVSGRSQGSGFGLAVVQQIARAHGGLVEYAPLPEGSRFRLRLPLEP